MTQKYSTRLPDSPMNLRVWQLAWPLILSNLALPIFSLVDTAVLGHLESPHYLGAVAIGSNLIMFLFWGFGFLRMGTTGITAQLFGRRETENVLTTLFQSVTLAVLIGIFLILIKSIYIQTGVSFMGASEIVSVHATSYLEIRIFSAPAILTTYAFIGWFIGQQNTRSPLIIFVMTNIINIVLDILLVIGLGLGVKGAAYASLIAEYSGLLISVYLARRYFKEHVLAKLIQNTFVIEQIIKLLSINRDIFIRTIFLLFSFLIFTQQGAKLGDIPLAANAVLINFLLLISHGLDGFAHASEALVGKAIGNRNVSDFYKSVRAAGEFSLFTAILFTLLFFLLGKGFIETLTDLQEVIDFAASYLPWIIALPVISFVGYLLDGVFVGATKSIAMRNSMIFSVVLVFIPAVYLSQPYGNHGLWFSFTLLMLARSVSMSYYFYRYSKQGTWLDIRK